MNRFFFILLLLSAAGAAAQTQPALTAEQILEKNLEATGGRKAWSQVETMTSVGTVSGHQISNRMTARNRTSGEFETTVRVYEQIPDKFLYYEGTESVANFLYGCTHEQIWWFAGSGDGKKKNEKPDECKVIFAPEKWSEIYDVMEVKGTKIINGRPAYEVHTGWKGVNSTLYFDCENFFLVRSKGVTAHGGWAAIAKETDYFDYRDVDGLKFPFQMKTQFNRGESQTTVTTIYVNARIAENVFRPPQDEKAKK
jgi:hypothetical protein